MQSFPACRYLLFSPKGFSQTLCDDWFIASPGMPFMAPRCTIMPIGVHKLAIRVPISLSRILIQGVNHTFFLSSFFHFRL
jgi:hypothetical protein